MEGNKDPGLSFQRNQDPTMIRYTNAGCMLNLHKDPKHPLYFYMEEQPSHESHLSRL
jgi:hypothetical protein